MFLYWFEKQICISGKLCILLHHCGSLGPLQRFHSVARETSNWLALCYVNTTCRKWRQCLRHFRRVKPVNNDRNCITKEYKMCYFIWQCPHSYCLFYLFYLCSGITWPYKSRLFNLCSATTCLERPPWRSVAQGRFHCMRLSTINLATSLQQQLSQKLCNKS